MELYNLNDLFKEMNSIQGMFVCFDWAEHHFQKFSVIWADA